MATYVAIKDFTGTKPAELTFRVGDLIRVTKKDEGQPMWIGSANGKVGSFPADCVEEKNTTSLRGSLISRGGGIFGTAPPPGGPGRHSSYVPAGPERPSEPPRARSNYTPSNDNPESEQQNLSTPSTPTQETIPKKILKPPAQAPPPGSKPALSRSLSSHNPGGIQARNSPLRATQDTSAISHVKPIRVTNSSPQSITPAASPPISAPVAIPASGKSALLPKFSDINYDDCDVDVVEAPPRSPPPQWKLSMLPPLPERPDELLGESTPALASPTSHALESPSSAPTSGASSGKKTNEELRLDCLNEIYQTEKDYVIDLDIIINVFILPLRVLNVVPEPTLYNIFSNIEVIINCNKEMLKEFDEQRASAANTEEGLKVGQVFLKLFDFFRMYKVYSANQQNSLTTVDTLLKKNPEFRKALDTCQADPKCRGLFLQSFLIKPIQRVCKYPLFLRELLRYTPEDHPDFLNLQEAFTKINEVVSNINEYQRQAEGLARILDLQKLIEGVDTLVAPGRYLQKEGDLSFYKNSKTKHPEKRHVFFFTDLIMLTTKKGDKKFEHKLSLPLESLTLTVLANSNHMKNVFELSTPQKGSKCILGCDTIDESGTWVREIRALKKEYQKRVLLEMQMNKDKALVNLN